MLELSFNLHDFDDLIFNIQSQFDTEINAFDFVYVYRLKLFIFYIDIEIGRVF